ncbi:MAG TPA: group I intron-associated PD-(D/E)XK endonuclease [Pyrinomonadaceae bacterium]|nr:group I intron-associated PD-(D/E)XK endonuclease [Pyrinomonadaceae bacterium]
MRLTQRKGDLATVQAIATFTKMGFDVSIPITESASYDIVVDTLEVLKRVQVKYSSDKKVDLRNIHSNSNGYVVKKAKDNSYDWLYVLYVKGDVVEEHLFKECFVNRRSVSLTESSQIIYGEVA